MFDQYTGRGSNTVDRADLNQLNKLDKSLGGEVIAHAAMEAYVGVAEGLGTYKEAHARANELFGDVKVGGIEALPAGAAMATSGRTVYDFRRVGTKATVEKTFITPQPAQSLPNNWERTRGNIRVIVPGQEMIKSLAVAAFVMTMVLCCPVFSQDQSKAKKIVGEGTIVTIQKSSRCRSCESSRGLGTFVEFWIVRVDQWIDGVARGEKYIRVEYNIYERGLSDQEINSGKLRFTFRERREGERTDCVGEIRSGSEPPFEWRKAELSDYERTKSGRLDEIPLLQSLPCLIADDPPVVIVDK